MTNTNYKYEFTGIFQKAVDNLYKGKIWGKKVIVSKIGRRDDFIPFDLQDEKLLTSIREGDKVTVEFYINGFKVADRSRVDAPPKYFSTNKAINIIKE